MLISYVDKIIDMRRNLVMVRSEFPQDLARPFQAIETNGNPWNFSRMDRAAWSDGLGVATMSDKLAPVSEVLHLAGTPDYQLRVACHDTAELDSLLRTLRLKLGAADTDTKIILRLGPPPDELSG